MQRPSLMLGLNGTSVRTAALYSATVLRNWPASTPSIFGKLFERVGGHLGDLLDPVFVAQQVHHLLSNTCQANCPGCFSTARPYFA